MTKNSLECPETHRSYDALQYPLLFPKGEDGYHFKLLHVDPITRAPVESRKVTALESVQLPVHVQR